MCVHTQTHKRLSPIYQQGLGVMTMAAGTLSTQTSTSKIHSSLKGIQEILKEMVNSRLGSEKYKSAYESNSDLKKKKKRQARA